jgi:L-alanine-DL-glutamate epimerase-like enolase superfamily enzyme
MTLELRHEVRTLRYRDPFRIARASHGGGLATTTVLVELRDSRYPDLVGYGEGYPDRFYGETPATMLAILPELLAAIQDFSPSPSGIRTASLRLASTIRWNGAAKCAIDVALHDLVGKVTGLGVGELVGVSGEAPPTDFTLGIDEPAIVADRAKRAAEFPALKIKLGGQSDLETLRAVRGVYNGPLRVDANSGWTRTQAAELLPDLMELGVELIEQPFPSDRRDWLAELQAASAIPIVADESCVTEDDLISLVGVVAGVNVKLAKCGGIGPAARMLARARELGFRTFLGCMEETSCVIAASAAVAPLAEWADLDGCLLIADDPFEGLELGADYRWLPSKVPGLGIRPRPAAAAAVAAMRGS